MRADLGFVIRADGAAQCGDCGAIFLPRGAIRAVEGTVLRSHRRRCEVRPASVPIPGRCEA